jgi:hypothetical protein
MKLYTEEQMHSVILLALGRHGIYIPNKHYQDLIDLLTPIELPSDEEMEEQSWGYREVTKDIDIPPNEDWCNGAKWMRAKIQGGNK